MFIMAITDTVNNYTSRRYSGIAENRLVGAMALRPTSNLTNPVVNLYAWH